MAIQTGSQIIDNRFILKDNLGNGGQGKVFMVEDNLNNKKKLAIKILETNTEEALKRFQKEINTISSINSENIISIISHNILDTQTNEKFNYYVMDYAKYGTLYDNDIKNHQSPSFLPSK